MITGTVAPDSGRVLFEGRDITRDKPEHRCRAGIARSFQIPQPFGGMTVFENLVVAAAFGGGRRERDVYGRCAELLEHAACSTRPTARRQSYSARSQTAGTRARAGDRSPRAAARRSRRRADRARNVCSSRTDQRRACNAACRSSGSSTSFMRSSRRSIAWWCCTAAVHRRGRTRRGDPPPAGQQKSIWGSVPMPDRLLEVRALDAYYGDFQALFGVAHARRRGRSRRRDRRQWRRQKHAAEVDRRCRCGSRRDAILFDGEPIGRSAGASTSWRAASRWCRRAGGCFPRSPSRKIS